MFIHFLNLFLKHSSANSTVFWFFFFGNKSGDNYDEKSAFRQQRLGNFCNYNGKQQILAQAKYSKKKLHEWQYT